MVSWPWRPPNRSATAVVAALAIAGLMGCDGGDETTDSASQNTGAAEGAPTKAQYVDRADAICRTALRETRTLSRRLGEGVERADTSDPLALTTEFLVEPALDIRERQRKRLLRLERPAEPSEDLEAYVDLFAPIEELIRQRVEAGRNGDLEEARELELLAAGELVEQRQAARRFGLRDCAADFMGELFSTEPSG